MSCEQSEYGTFKLPSAAAPAFRKALGTFINRRAIEAYATADRCYNAVISANKGKRNVNYRAALTDWLEVQVPAPFREEHFEDMDIIFFGGDRHRIKPMKPKKKDFPQVKFTQGFRFVTGNFSLSVCGREVRWLVPENNRAVEIANEHAVAAELYSLLRKVEWTRGSGGAFVSEDEYAGPSCIPFGPLGEKREKAFDLKREAEWAFESACNY